MGFASFLPLVTEPFETARAFPNSLASIRNDFASCVTETDPLHAPNISVFGSARPVMAHENLASTEVGCQLTYTRSSVNPHLFPVSESVT